jgi:hypothetical protein
MTRALLGVAIVGMALDASRAAQTKASGPASARPRPLGRGPCQNRQPLTNVSAEGLSRRDSHNLGSGG